jgi:glycerophosphoryl diester phosphodiesterase
MRSHGKLMVFSLVAVGLSGCVTPVPAPLERAEATCRIESIRADLFDHPSRGVLVAAHRGFHTHQPENSLAAIEAAISAGIDIVEIDVQVSKDGVPILMHDDTIDRTTSGSGRPDALTYAELHALRLAAPDGTFSSHTVPSFDAALALAKGNIWVQIDLKSVDLSAILPVVDAHQMWNQVSFFNSDPAVLRAVFVANPHAIVMPIARDPEQFQSLAIDPAFRAIHLTEATANQAAADVLDAYKKPGWLNSLGLVDDAVRATGVSAAMDPLLELRPDIVQTDAPDILLAYLRARELHWSMVKPCS